MKYIITLLVLSVFVACSSSGSGGEGSDEVSFVGTFASADGDTLKIEIDDFSMTEGISFDLVGETSGQWATVFNTVDLDSREGDLDKYHFLDTGEYTYSIIDFTFNSQTGEWEIDDIGFKEKGDENTVDFSGTYKKVGG